LIKIAYNISNLSDARYFAAYGFDWIIFNFGPGAGEHKHLLYGIAEWISGSNIGIAVQNQEELHFHIENHPEIKGFWLPPEMLITQEIGDTAIFSENESISAANFFQIISNVEELDRHKGNLIIDLTYNDPSSTDLSSIAIHGVAISGTEEERPGFKSYGNMEDWMDVLDEHR